MSHTAWIVAMLSATFGAGETPLEPKLATYVAERVTEFDTTPEERQKQLAKISKYVRETRAAGQPVKLTFICTHNSRRSHFAQVWAKIAAVHYGIPVETYSGGTEATAFNPRSVAALQRAGFDIAEPGEETNPRYRVRYAANIEPLVCFSKKYADQPNPQAGFGAILTCSDADKKCPTVSGATVRIPVPYDDPKISDNTAKETVTYDERCRQIAREMLFVMSQIDAR